MSNLRAYWKAWKPMIQLAAIVMLITLLPLVFGVWLPDLIRSRPNVLAEERLENGQTVRVIQFWRWHAHKTSNYKTEFEVTSANGTLIKYVVVEEESDTRKRWRMPLTVTLKDGRAHAVLKLSDTYVRKIDW